MQIVECLRHLLVYLLTLRTHACAMSNTTRAALRRNTHTHTQRARVVPSNDVSHSFPTKISLSRYLSASIYISPLFLFYSVSSPFPPSPSAGVRLTSAFDSSAHTIRSDQIARW
ncbi:hypothetical protein GGS23DRAFT_576385 [Durotheca rogersii]|uniref:uncharacterized protein n=1 Tax=Durotheca rogersii TaxID=419775 RepID=UPI0022211436|nr:uncharacterized protein GGS23DRAFT_576385 [Durotheca rogersii]KAI5861336.1 hypothetical protein GGS23DRAFT_576385 [Durotheca rogersii]